MTCGSSKLRRWGGSWRGVAVAGGLEPTAGEGRAAAAVGAVALLLEHGQCSWWLGGGSFAGGGAALLLVGGRRPLYRDRLGRPGLRRGVFWLWSRAAAGCGASGAGRGGFPEAGAWLLRLAHQRAVGRRCLTDAGLFLGEVATREGPAAAGRGVPQPLGRAGASAAGGRLWQLPGCDAAGRRGVLLVLARAGLLLETVG